MGAIGRGKRAAVLGPRHGAGGDAAQLCCLEARHRHHLETEWLFDAQACWILLGLGHLCDLFAFDATWSSARLACLRIVTHDPDMAATESRETIFLRTRSIAEKNAIEASWVLADHRLPVVTPDHGRTTLRGSKTAVIVGMLSCIVRTLLHEAVVFLERSSNPAFMSVLHANTDAATPTSMSGLVAMEKQWRSAIEDAAGHVLRVAKALASADGAFAHRWHCYANEVERDTSLSLYEQAEIEKTFLWVRTTVLRCQIRCPTSTKKNEMGRRYPVLVLGVLGQWLPCLREDLAAEHARWCMHSFQAASMTLLKAPEGSTFAIH